MAWRNVWRNKRRSGITLAASSFGLAVLIFLLAFMDGLHEQMVRNATRMLLGHLQVYARGFREDPVPEKAIPDPERVREALARVPGLAHALPRVSGYGLVSSADNSVGVQILGVDPALEEKATRIPKTLVEGGYLGRDSGRVGEILIGKALAKRLRAVTGDKIVLLAQAADGSMASALFRVKGVFKTGAEGLDLGTVFVSLGRAQEFFALGTQLREDRFTVQGFRAFLETLFAGRDAEVEARIERLTAELLACQSCRIAAKELDRQLAAGEIDPSTELAGRLGRLERFWIRASDLVQRPGQFAA